MIHIKNFDANKIKSDQNLSKYIFIYLIGFVTLKEPSYVTIKSVNPL